jgi:hypothetical protein
MKPIVYIETSIPSFYFEVRPEPEMVARRQWTRDWWTNARNRYHLVTSAAVLSELDRGNYPNKGQALDLIRELPLIPIETEVADLVGAYIRHRVMPNDPTGDALHLALASYHRCDFLLTWNCRHLANANKFGHIQRVNQMLGMHIPLLTTPMELLGGGENE